MVDSLAEFNSSRPRDLVAMIYSIDANKYLEAIPHQSDYKRWRSGLSDDEYQAIYNDLFRRIDGSEIQTSSWIPGRDWRGTVFQPIYEKACEYDSSAAAKFFGLILWHAVMDHDETWTFGRYKVGELPIEGLTYFRIDDPNGL